MVAQELSRRELTAKNSGGGKEHAERFMRWREKRNGTFPQNPDTRTKRR